MPRKTKRPIKEKPYDNCKMLSPDGEFMAFVSEKSMKWYLKKNLAIEIEKKVFQLTFEPKGNGNQDDVNYQQVPRKNKCVVCGVEDNLTMHHIIPYCYRKFLPLKYKNRNSFDVICVCHECHDKYEKTALVAKMELAQRYGIVFNGEFSDEARKSNKLTGLALALQRYGKQMPEERIREIEETLSQAFEQEVTIKNIAQVIEERNLEFKQVFKGRNEISKLVLQSFLDEGKEVIDFVLFWRKHFLKNTKPKHLSKLWLSDYKKREW